MIGLHLHFGYGVGFLRDIKTCAFDLRNLICSLDVYMKILNQQLESCVKRRLLWKDWPAI